MIRAHPWSKIFRLTWCHLNCVAALPNKNCAVNINISYRPILQKKYRACDQLEANHTEQVKYDDCMRLYGVLEVTALRKNILCFTPFTPLVNRDIDKRGIDKNVLVKLH